MSVDKFNFDVFERAVEIMARHLAFFRADDAEVTDNDWLTAGHLAGALAAQSLLVAELPSTESVRWQPISSAPKDGSTILIWSAGSQTLHVVMWNGEDQEATEKLEPTHWLEIPQPPEWRDETST